MMSDGLQAPAFPGFAKQTLWKGDRRAVDEASITCFLNENGFLASSIIQL